MSDVIRALALFALFALAACGGEAEPNVVITNEVPADADIEVLPADESAGTPAEELANGTADPNVNEAVVNGG